MDKLEKFIHKNRSRFDTDEPGRDLWSSIEEQIKPEVKIVPVKRTFNYWRVAAVVLLLCSFALVIDRFTGPRPTSSEEWVSGFFTSEFQEAEGFYLQMVEERKAVLEEQLKDDPQSKEAFLAEIDALDDKYEQLKGEIKFGNQQEILDAMILNLQMRIEVLNRQIEIIEQYNTKDNDDEKISI